MPPESERPRADEWRRQPLDWARQAGHGDRLLAALGQRERRQRRRRRAAGLTVALACLVAGAALFLERPPAPATPAATGTPRSPLVVGPERRTLPDGTVVELRPGSDIEVGFAAAGAGPRAVTLRHGEAHFQVASNPLRPFVVSAGPARFQAVGTAFSVAIDPAAVEMIVTEGRVALVTETADPTHDAIVTAGQRAIVPTAPLAPPPQVTSVTPAQTGEKLGWRVPRLEFNETPLAEVVDLIHRHSATRLRLIGRDLRAIEITGALRADNLDPLLRMLENHYGIRVSTLPGGEIGLESAR